MALIASSMASYIYQSLGETDNPNIAISRFYQALCSYCEENMEIQYSWGASMPPPVSTPDPTVLLNCKVKTTGSLSPSGATTPEAALSQFAADLNSQVSLWKVVWPEGFIISTPAFVIPGIVFTPSMATTPEAAWGHICQEIINGITLEATPGPLPGVHGSFTVPTPGAIFSKIL